MASITLELLDHVAGIIDTDLNASGDYKVERKILPRTQKQKRSKPEIFISINKISSEEHSRGDLHMIYEVSVGLVYEAPKEVQQEAALSLVDDILGTLESSAHRLFTTTSGYKFSYRSPFTLEPVFDAELLNEQGTFISAGLFNYVYIKDR